MVEGLHREALAWAAGGRGRPLVDAAAEALAAGLDSPSLRMLAGATRAMADEEADEWAAKTFQELGLEVASRFSAEAVIAFAQLRAWEFLRSRGSINQKSARLFAAELYGYYVDSEYSGELGPTAGFDDAFGLVEEGYYGSVHDLIPSFIAVLQALAAPSPSAEVHPSRNSPKRLFRDG